MIDSKYYPFSKLLNHRAKTTAVMQIRSAGKGYHCLRYQCTLIKKTAMVHRRGEGKGYYCLRYQCIFDEDNGGGA